MELLLQINPLEERRTLTSYSVYTNEITFTKSDMSQLGKYITFTQIKWLCLSHLFGQPPSPEKTAALGQKRDFFLLFFGNLDFFQKFFCVGKCN